MEPKQEPSTIAVGARVLIMATSHDRYGQEGTARGYIHANSQVVIDFDDGGSDYAWPSECFPMDQSGKRKGWTTYRRADGELIWVSSDLYRGGGGGVGTCP